MSDSNDESLRRRRNAKSADAFRTISEVSGELDVPQHVLRFWETKFSQIRPLKRGGGRRYYRPEDIDLLRKVRHWLYAEGYTIKGVQKLLREGAARTAGQGQGGSRSAYSAADSQQEGSARERLDTARRAEISALVQELEAIRETLRLAG